MNYIMEPDGSEFPIDCEDEEQVKEVLSKVDDEALFAYVMAEEVKGQPHKEPPSVDMMRRHELIDYESASDQGHFRFYPKGQLIFELLRMWAEEVAMGRLGAYQIETPIIYDVDDPEIQAQAGSFHERHYKVQGDKSFLLRFAGDFGLFKIMKQAKLSYKHLPVRVYEFSKSFRFEQSGELSGLKRLRAFHMPDVHCFCRDLEQGWDEYEHLYRHYADLADAMEVSYAIVFRVVREFYESHKDRIQELLKYSGRPAFIEVMPEMRHYWAVKHEFQGIDSVGGNLQLSTVQLDVKDAETYGIVYQDHDGGKKGCIICHSSVGSIERWIYAILEEAHKMEHGQLPLWLSPVQLRVIPVAERHVEHCMGLSFDGVRVDVDDRSERLGKKIANASSAWIPYVAVVGDEEVSKGMVRLRDREGEEQLLSPAKVQELIRGRCRGLPFRDLPLPRRVSRQLSFR